MGLQLLLSLSILIVLHEFGHFLPSKIFGVRVEKFYLFFDPWFSVIKKKIGETEYGIGWLPLGGYVKLSGMIDESMDKEQMLQPEQPWEFRSKPAWQRLIIMLGGIIMNVILGILFYGMILFVWGKDTIPTDGMKYGIYADSLAQSIGLQDGDIIQSMDGERLANYRDIRKRIFLDKAQTIEVKRGGQDVSIQIPETLASEIVSYKGVFVDIRFPVTLVEVPDDSPNAGKIQAGDQLLAVGNSPIQFSPAFNIVLKQASSSTINTTWLRGNDTITTQVAVSEDGKLGMVMDGAQNHIEFVTKEYGLGEAAVGGFTEAYDFLFNIYIRSFGRLFDGTAKVSESLGGFGTFAKMFPTDWNWEVFWKNTAMLSLILAFMNLLPIPALDGGHVVFLLYEMVTGKKPSDKFMEYATIAGFVFVMGLVLLANGLDIWRWLGG